MDYLVKCDYAAQGLTGLTLKEGDKICNAEVSSDGWIKGTLLDKSGLMPEKFLKLRSWSISAELLSTLEFKVHHEYTANNPDELTIEKGDLIGNVQNSFVGWNNGTLIHEPGLFPENFVKLHIVESSANTFKDMEFQVLSDYTAQKPGELTIREGNIITNVQYATRGWNMGTLKEQCGLFHDNHVIPGKISSHLLSTLDFVVIYDYTSRKADELTLRKGDIIRQVKKLYTGWNQGSLNGKIGLFPDNFVKVRNPSQETLSQIGFIVTTNYTPKLPNQTEHLTIRKGDLITNVQLVNDGLYKGTIVGQTGMFPDNLVKICNASSELLKNKELIAIADYTSQDSEKMSLKKGDLIKDVQYMQDGWYKGTKVGKSGMFPDNFVTLCSSNVEPSFLETFEFEVIFNYTSKTSGQPSLIKGDTVKNVQLVSNGWVRGTVIGKTGIFPSNFVEVIRDPNDAPKNLTMNLTREVQKMSIKQRDIPEELVCPVCLELPDKEIYQCKNGHTLCVACILNIQNCPQCRISLSVDGGLIRNRVAEALVSSFKSRVY